MRLEEAHRICAAVAGQLALALLPGRVPQSPMLARAATALRRVADALESASKASIAP